jgi:hypothetical protein
MAHIEARRLGSHAQHVISINTKTGTIQFKNTELFFNFRFNQIHGHVGHGCLRGPAQPTGYIMNQEFLSQLQNDLLAIIITLTLVAIILILIGYRVVAKRLAQRGMKKGDARAIGQATALLLFLLIAGIYFKLFVLG